MTLSIRKFLILSLLFFFCFSLESYSQFFKKKTPYSSKGNFRKKIFYPYTSIGVSAGTTNYYGEIYPIGSEFLNSFKTPGWHVGVEVSRKFTQKFSARLAFNYARVRGNDFWTDNSSNFTRNLHFRNDIKELSVTGILDLTQSGESSQRRKKIIPYVFAGLAIFAHDPQAKLPLIYPSTVPQAEKDRYPAGSWISLQPLGTEGQYLTGSVKSQYSLVSFSVPLGFGVRYKFNDVFDISFEIGARYSFSNYIDDIGDNGPSTTDLASSSIITSLLTVRSLESMSAANEGDRVAIMKKLYPNITFETPIDNTNRNIALGDAQFANASKRVTSPLAYNDIYVLTGFKLNYVMNSKQKCYKPR